MNFSLGFIFGTIFGAMATVTIIAVLFMSKREPAEREYYCSVYEIDGNELVYSAHPTPNDGNQEPREWHELACTRQDVRPYGSANVAQVCSREEKPDRRASGEIWSNG